MVTKHTQNLLRFLFTSFNKTNPQKTHTDREQETHDETLFSPLKVSADTKVIKKTSEHTDACWLPLLLLPSSQITAATDRD
jgi:hypothetical protein